MRQTRNIHDAEIKFTAFTKATGASAEFAAFKYGGADNEITVFLTPAQVAALAASTARAVELFREAGALPVVEYTWDFVSLRSGKLMPVEAATTETYYLHLGQSGHPQMVLVTENGEVLRGRLGKESESGVTKVIGRESHFARCPEADKFRR